MNYLPGDIIAPKVDYYYRTVKPLDMPPEVSIILPAYNAHNTIKRTIASICMQEDVDEIEIIIADDCSDEPYDHIAALFSHMVRIRVVRMLKNGGPGAARQIGFDYSVGKYIMWMDTDDTLVSADTILTLKNVMIQREMDCVYGKFLEQNEDGSIFPHEQHMVWMFGKLYRRSFIEKYNIRFNTSLSNEDTGYNCVVKGCTDRIWYIPKDVYIWHFKPNSITRIKQGMYGQDSGYKGYLDNMVWQIKELEKRFVNKNYILSEIVSILCVLYHFHVENMQQCPLNIETSMNWIRGYYDLVVRPHEDAINEVMLMQTFANVAAGQNIAAKGIIPKMTFEQFLEEVKKPWVEDKDQEIRGSTPAGYIPPITDKNWPVKVSEYTDLVEKPIDVDSDTNFSRYGGMKDKLGIARDDKDYDIHYDGSKEMEEERINNSLKSHENHIIYTDSPHQNTAKLYKVKDNDFTINENISNVPYSSIPAPHVDIFTTNSLVAEVNCNSYDSYKDPNKIITAWNNKSSDSIKEAVTVINSEVDNTPKKTSSSKFGVYDPGEATCCGNGCNNCSEE